jgi:hypothetical protein
LLADGRLVFGTNRRGLQVETAPGTDSYAFIPGPIRVTSGPNVTADGLAWIQGRWIFTTADGRHWDRVDALAGQ